MMSTESGVSSVEAFTTAQFATKRDGLFYCMSLPFGLLAY